MSNRDEQGRFAATSSANPHSLTPAQPFGYAKPYNHSNAATAPAPIDLTAKYGQKGGPRAARIPAGGPRPLGMVSDLALRLAPPIEREQQKPQQQPVAEGDPAGPMQPPLKPQEPITQTPALPSMDRPALSGTGRLALPAGPSAVEQITPGSPIPPAVDGLLEGKRPASYSVVALGSKYTRSAHPNALGGLVGGLDE